MNQNITDKPDWALSKRERKNRARVKSGHRVARRRWPFVIVAIVLVVGVLGFAISQRVAHREAAATLVSADASVPVMQLLPSEITTLTPRTLQQTVRVTGALVPGQQAQLSSQVSGRVLSVAVEPGDSVKAGETLVQLDVETLQNQLNQQRDTAAATRAQLTQAQNQLERVKALAGKGISSTSSLEQAQSSVNGLAANLRALEAQVSNAENMLANATVTAPFAGIVSARSVDPGQSIAVGAQLLTLVSLKTMVAETTAPAGDSPAIAKGQQVNVRVNGIPGEVFKGTVDRINPVAIPGTRTIPVYVDIANPKGTLRGGMFVIGDIVVAERASGLAVPPTAIRTDDQGTYVLKVEDGRAVRQAVTQGKTWDASQLIGITAGVQAGDIVISAPLAQVHPDDKVALVKD